MCSVGSCEVGVPALLGTEPRRLLSQQLGNGSSLGKLPVCSPAARQAG